MTAKKETTTKGKAEGSDVDAVAMRRRYAEFLARLLAHPDVSNELKNTIGAAIQELADRTKTYAANPRLLPLLYPLMLDEVPEGYEEGLRNGLFAAIESVEDEGLVEEIRRQVFDGGKGTGDGHTEAAWGERRGLTPAQAAALVGKWETNGDEHTGDLILLCRALVYGDRNNAEGILIAIEREKATLSPSVNAALDGLVESRRRAWQKEVQR